MNFAILIALGVCFGYAVLQRGGVEWADWSLALLGTGISASLYFAWRLLPARSRGPAVPSLDKISGISAVTVLCLIAFQLIPLPASLVRHLSPKRVEIQQAFQSAAGPSPLPDARQQAEPGITLSSVPRATAQYLLTTSAYVLIFLLIRDLALRLDTWRWAAICPPLVVVAGEALLGLIQIDTGGSSAFAIGTYANRDHYAGLIEMMLPFPVMFAAAALRRESTRFETPAAPAIKASVLFGAAAIMLAAVVLSLSRMGFLASLASLLVAGLGIAWSLGANVKRGFYERFWRRWVPTAAVVVLVFTAIFLLPTNSLLARFADFSTNGDVSPDTRIQIWHDAEGLIRDYPLFGCGMGAFESCFLKYKTAAPGYTVDYVHNDYLQVLAELGIVGFAAGLLFVIRLFQRVIQASFRSRSLDDRYLAVACAASMTAILLHSFVDFNMYVPANGMLFAWIAGIAGVFLKERHQPQPKTIS